MPETTPETQRIPEESQSIPDGTQRKFEFEKMLSPQKEYGFGAINSP